MPCCNAAFGPTTNSENPFLHHARTLAVLETSIARIQKRLPDFERAESAARESAIRYAKDRGIPHDFDASTIW